MGRKAVDMTGQKYGLLTVVERCGSDKYSKPLWKCKCECGQIAILPRSALIHGQKSCGCMQGVRTDILTPELLRVSHNNRLYNTWSAMRERCYAPRKQNYKYYGGRGITVCDEWKDDFKAFAEWAIANGYTDTLELDRIDTDGNYTPENCRWVTHMENSWTRGVKSTNKSGVTGVLWTPSRSGNGGKWRAVIMTNGKRLHLGYFETIAEAQAARRKAEIEQRGK